MKFPIYNLGMKPDILIERTNYIDTIMKYVDTPFVKILTGIRRCGKTTILHMIASRLMKERNVPEERIVKVRFDSMEYDSLSAKEMYSLLKSSLSSEGRTYLFLDEVQEIKGWEKVINSIQTDFDTDIYVTGSNSRMMPSEISSYLTGRYVSFNIYTLSFREYLSFLDAYGKRTGSEKEEFQGFLRNGGFPATVMHKDQPEMIRTIVEDIYTSTIFRDIVERSQIRKIDQLGRVVKYVFQNVGNTFSAKGISDFLKSENRKIDVETVYNYLEQLEKAYIIHRCPRFDLKGKEILKTQEKFYLADTSLRYSVLGYDSNSASASMENIIYLELRRRGYDTYIGKQGDKEVDFTAERHGEKIYVQVTERISAEKTENREYGVLESIKDNYPKYVVTSDDFSGGNHEGIKTMHIADFLLSDEY